MPHIIVEHSDTLDLSSLLPKLHLALADQGVDQSRIKTRAIPLHNAIVGTQGPAGQMVHITLLLLEGRDIETRQKYGQAVYDVLKNASLGSASLTLEVRDMVKDTYFMP